MKCPYCNKSVKDVPDHLNKTKECSMAHGKNLLNQFRGVVAQHRKRQAEWEDKRI